MSRDLVLGGVRAVMAGGLLLLGLAAGARAQQQRPANAAPAAPTRVEYTIGPGDVLQIVVRKEPDLSRDVLVRLDGRITVPLLGDLDAEGRSPKQISEDIARGLARFVNDPWVTVAVGQALSARAYVIGQVVRSGEIPLSVPLTVVQALALSGGFKEFAKRDAIMVVGRDRKVATFDFKKFETGRDLEQNVTLKPGDTVVVP
jgi:polysaccharide export outer membrane protein